MGAPSSIYPGFKTGDDLCIFFFSALSAGAKDRLRRVRVFSAHLLRLRMPDGVRNGDRFRLAPGVPLEVVSTSVSDAFAPIYRTSGRSEATTR